MGPLWDSRPSFTKTLFLGFEAFIEFDPLIEKNIKKKHIPCERRFLQGFS